MHTCRASSSHSKHGSRSVFPAGPPQPPTPCGLARLHPYLTCPNPPASQSIIYSISRLSHDEANRRLGGTTALLKAHSSIVLDMVAKEAVQCFGGLGVTRGGKGDRVERIRRDVTGVTIPGGAEPILLDNGVKQEVRLALGLGARL